MKDKRKNPTWRMGRQAARATSFASQIVSQTAERSNPATQKQKNCLVGEDYDRGLRKQVGLDVWNDTKARLGITTPGVKGLSKRDASRLIGALLAYLRSEAA